MKESIDNETIADESRWRIATLEMNLMEAKVGEEYIVDGIMTDDEELNSFLFSLGCYSGEPITVISQIRGGCVISVKDARYNIDHELAGAISVKSGDV